MKRIQSLKPHLTQTMRFGITTFIPIFKKKKKSSIAAITSSIFRFQGSFIEILLKIDNFMYKRITK